MSREREYEDPAAMRIGAESPQIQSPFLTRDTGFKSSQDLLPKYIEQDAKKGVIMPVRSRDNSRRMKLR